MEKESTTNSNSTESTNKTILLGTIVNKYETNKVIIFTLGITQFISGQNGNPKKISNYPKIYFFKSDDTGAENYMLHDKVKVTAHVASSKKRRDDGTPFVSQALVGDMVEDVKTVLENELGNVKGGGYEPNMNVTFLKGQVKEIRKISEGVTSITMQAMNNGKLNIVTVISFNKKIIEMIDVKDVITVTGSIHTKKKEYDGKMHYFENVVAQRIDKVS